MLGNGWGLRTLLPNVFNVLLMVVKKLLRTFQMAQSLASNGIDGLLM